MQMHSYGHTPYELTSTLMWTLPMFYMYMSLVILVTALCIHTYTYTKRPLSSYCSVCTSFLVSCPVPSLRMSWPSLLCLSRSDHVSRVRVCSLPALQLRTSGNPSQCKQNNYEPAETCSAYEQAVAKG